MATSEVETPDGHTRWSRFAIAVVPAVVAVGVALGGLYTGVLAATFAVGGVDVTVKSNHVDIAHMGAFGDGVTMVNGSSKQVASAGIGQAQLTGLCAAIKVPVPVFGGFNIKITAPKDDPVDATDLVLNATGLGGDLYAENIAIGVDASTVDQGPIKGVAGSNGLQASKATIDNLNATAYKLSAGTFRVHGVGIGVTGADDGC